MFDKLKMYKESAQSRVDAKMSGIWAKVDDMDDGITKTAITDIIQLVGIAAVTIVIMIYIISQITDTMPEPTDTDLSNTTDTTISTFGSTMELATVALIIIVAGAILFYVRDFGGGNQGGMR